jgi:hypothetical protein
MESCKGFENLVAGELELAAEAGCGGGVCPVVSEGPEACASLAHCAEDVEQVPGLIWQAYPGG